jgi:hypothetical protein
MEREGGGGNAYHLIVTTSMIPMTTIRLSKQSTINNHQEIRKGKKGCYMDILMRINKRCQVNVSGMYSRLQHWSHSREPSKQILAKLRLIYMGEKKYRLTKRGSICPTHSGGFAGSMITESLVGSSVTRYA